MRLTAPRDEYQAARDCLEATAREDPDNVRTSAMLAYLRKDAARFGHELERSRHAAFELTGEAATRAIDLDPRDKDALQAMSQVEQYYRDIKRLIDHAGQPVDVNLNDPAALANFAMRLGSVGEISEAVPIKKYAVDRSLASPPCDFHLFSGIT